MTNWSNTKQVTKRTVVHKVTRTSKTTSKLGGYVKISSGIKISAKARGKKGYDGGIGVHMKVDVTRATEEIETTAETDTSTVTVHTLPKHRMSLVMQDSISNTVL